MSKNVTRLFDQFNPSHYQLHVSIDEPTMTFSGKVAIKGKKTGRPSKRLTFHQKNLQIQSAVITHHDKKGHVVKDIARINNHPTFEIGRAHV